MTSALSEEFVVMVGAGDKQMEGAARRLGRVVAEYDEGFAMAPLEVATCTGAAETERRQHIATHIATLHWLLDRPPLSWTS